MTRASPSLDFDIHVDRDCSTPAMEDLSYLDDLDVSVDGSADHHDVDHIPVDHDDSAATPGIVEDPEDDDLPTGPTGEPEFDVHDNLSIHEVLEGTDELSLSPTSPGTDDPDETVHANSDQDARSRPVSSASQSYRGTEDDVFSDRSPRSSIHSADDHSGEDAMEERTEKGNQSPDIRSRVTSGVSGVSTSGASAISDLSHLSHYDKEDFLTASHNSQHPYRSPSSARTMQRSSPTSSIYSSSARPAKRQPGLATDSRRGSPTASAQYSAGGRSTPSRFKRPEPAPLVLLHVTLLPLRWVYGDVINHFESRKLQPLSFSSEGLKNLRGAWRQLQDRLGDTEMERGVLLPHPQNDYEVLEERLLEALELPLRRRARILECGHYLGPSNEMTIGDDIEEDSEGISADEQTGAGGKKAKRHWCKSCRGDIKYQELGSERVFRIKVYASNGLMSAGAWDACWREMERVDIEVEPIVALACQQDLAKLAATFEQDQRKQLELEDEQRKRFEAERRQILEEERRLLEAQRRDFEQQRQQLEQQRKANEREQRQNHAGTRRQEPDEVHHLLEQQRQELEARRQFEEERRQRLDDELKQAPATRPASRASYAEDELASPGAETDAETDIDGRGRDTERLREIYGDHLGEEAVDSATQESSANSNPSQSENHYSDPYTTPSSPYEQAYKRYEDRRASLRDASLPRLFIETIRVAFQDPRNVTLVVVVVLIAVLAGQYWNRGELGVELYTPQQHVTYQYHELEAGNVAGQLAMNTPPAIGYTETTSAPSLLVETVYKTVTKAPGSSATNCYQETSTSRDVEAIHTTVTDSLVEPSAQSKTEAADHTAATEVASELLPNSSDPSFALNPLPFCWWDDEEIHRNASSFHIIGGAFDTLAPSPSSPPETETEPEPRSNEEILKTTSEEAEIDTEVDHLNISIFNPICMEGGEEPSLATALSENEGDVEKEFTLTTTSPEALMIEPEATTVAFPNEESASKKEAARTTASTTFTTPVPQTTSNSCFATSAIRQKRIVKMYETVTETVFVTATRTRSAPEMKMTSGRITHAHDDRVLKEDDGNFEDGDDILRETLIETVKVTSTVEVDWPETTCDVFGPYTPALGTQKSFEKF
ncbi:hypothetical protein SLS53_001434 [Cytospora paraplurivora]|uniref:Pathway-specific nitrogen regulator n=1 Tax=Cytospora paraplurivora TaxID=2898453 RepID=A0AAN9UH53_9PEZI